MLYPRLRELRKTNNLTQRQLAEQLHCSQQVYSNYELGQRDIPTQMLITLARYYHTSTDDLLGLSARR